MKILEVAKIYLDRKNRLSHPEGTFDKGGRFYPDKFEDRDCCKFIRSPSRSYPYSLMHHCRSIDHIANLYKKDLKKLKIAIKKLK